jgi:transcriptional regulator with XRE-family HTH domain
MPRQSDLAKAAGLHQSRISMFETPGAANMTIETLARLAAAFKVGLMVRFVPFSEMLRWENDYSQDHLSVTPLAEDEMFLNPPAVEKANISKGKIGGLSQSPVNKVTAMPVGRINPFQSSKDSPFQTAIGA